jgi:ankyrin repeat protein
MPTRLSLPDHPNLQHLKNQAKDLLKSGAITSLAKAQFEIARQYGFPSWPKLKFHVESFEEIGRLKQSIDTNDLATIQKMMTANPALHEAPLGYNKNGPLTWVAECRIPWEAPSAQRLKIATWMMDHGSDIHQGGDGPLMRAALVGIRIPMMELLVSRGADVNALWNGHFPILFAPCETLEPLSLQWLLDHGANSNCQDPSGKHPGSALDYVVGTYSRSENLPKCIDILSQAGAVTRYNDPPLLALLRNNLDELSGHLRGDPDLSHKKFPNLNIGNTGMRRMTLCGATLLHVAAEYGNREAVALLLDQGADVNAQANVDESGIGGQTPIFHCASQFYDWGLATTKLLIERGANLGVRATVPGRYDLPDEFVTATPLAYAQQFPGTQSETLALLRAHHAPE